MTGSSDADIKMLGDVQKVIVGVGGLFAGVGAVMGLVSAINAFLPKAH